MSNAFHNYKYELESLEAKYFWFVQNKLSVYDLFEDGDILKPLREELVFPKYLRDQILTIKNWYLEMNQYSVENKTGN